MICGVTLNEMLGGGADLWGDERVVDGILSFQRVDAF
jgi:hypothetical protein